MTIFPAKPGEVFRVHTSDRATYRRCRRLFTFSANVEGAMGLEPYAWNKHLWLGTGVHKALELWYRHVGYPRPVDDPEPTEPFVDTPAARFRDWRADWESKPDNRELLMQMSVDDRAEYTHYCILGNSMLTHYLAYAKETDNSEDKGFEIVETEIKFSLPILDLNGDQLYVDRVCPLWPRFGREGSPCPEHSNTVSKHHIHKPAVYEGRFDGIVRDRYERLWILEHKTYKSFDSRMMFNDDQSSSYLWAAKRIYGHDFAGVLYNVLLKKIPVIPPVVYKGKPKEGLSRDVRNVLKMTTYDIYMKAIVDNDYKVENYSEELELLEGWGWDNFFRREWVERNANETQETGMRIYHETVEMSSPGTVMYPNPDKMRCPWCPFRVPCMALSSGDDWKEILKEGYRKRESTDVDVDDVEFMPV